MSVPKPALPFSQTLERPSPWARAWSGWAGEGGQREGRLLRWVGSSLPGSATFEGGGQSLQGQSLASRREPEAGPGWGRLQRVPRNEAAAELAGRLLDRSKGPSWARELGRWARGRSRGAGGAVAESRAPGRARTGCGDEEMGTEAAPSLGSWQRLCAPPQVPPRSYSEGGRSWQRLCALPQVPPRS